MIRRRVRYAVAVVVVLSLAGASFAVASRGDGGGSQQFSTHLIGYNEVPSLNSPGQGDLALDVTDSEIKFTLTYANLTGPPLVAHIHVGQPGVAGGVSVFFCGGGGKPPCPGSNSGTVTGSIVATDVVGPTAQGFQAGDLAPVVAAIRAGFTYANMHTQKFPPGEIRGQIRRGGGDGESGDN
jgi:hypothetical protein